MSRCELLVRAALVLAGTATGAACLGQDATSHDVAPSEKQPVRDRSSAQFALIGDDTPVVVELTVQIDGVPLGELWRDEKTFAPLLSWFDRDGDQVISLQESRRLPSPFGLRQLLWNPLLPLTQSIPLGTSLDRDRDQRIGTEEVVSFYRSAGIGGVWIGVGCPPCTEKLTVLLVEALDGDGNRDVDEAELQAAEKLLDRFDANDDERLTANELLPGFEYPGAAGTRLLSPTQTQAVAGDDGPPVIALPLGPEGGSDSVKAIIRQRDRDGDGCLTSSEVGLSSQAFREYDANGDSMLSAEELAAWRKSAAKFQGLCRFGRRTDQDDLFSLATGFGDEIPDGEIQQDGLRIVLRVDEGRLSSEIDATAAELRRRFEDGDSNNDGVVAADDTTSRGREDLAQLISAADRDADGRLRQDEFHAWLELQSALTAGCVLMTVLDFRRGLWECLDADHDGALSMRELRSARGRLHELGGVHQGKIAVRRLPRHVMAIVSRGHPVAPLGTVRRAGPAWFLAMDRNRDGDLSQREFVAAGDKFAELDRDRDGLLTPDEASATPGSTDSGRRGD